MRNNIILILLLCITATACRKGELIKGQYNGELRLELAALPNSPSLDIYFNGVFIDTLPAFSGYKPFILPAEKDLLLEMKKRNSNEVVLDTSIVIPREAMLSLRMAYNAEMGLQQFLGGSDIDPDSVKVQFYNMFPDGFIPGNPEIEAEILYESVYQSGEYIPYEMPKLVPFSKGKVYPAVFTLAAKREDGTPIDYMVQCRDANTKEPYTDLFGRLGGTVYLGEYAGKFIIAQIQARTFRNSYVFNNVVIEL